MKDHDKQSASKTVRKEFKIQGGFWENAWKVPAVLALLGIAGSIGAWLTDPDRFAFSYLFAFVTCLTIALGGLFFVIVQHITGAHWAVGIRRVTEFVLLGVPSLVILIIPVLFSTGTLYEWTHLGGHGDSQSEHAESSSQHSKNKVEQTEESLLGTSIAHAESKVDHNSDHGEAEHAHTPQEKALHHKVLEGKTPYLNLSGFFIRLFLSLLVWLIIAHRYFRWSTQQDENGDLVYSQKMEKYAPLAAFLLGITLTFSAFDLMMSLEPAWYSTIFGVYIFAGSAVVIFAITILLGLSLRKHGYLGKAATEEHFHDLGKLLFGFTCFWAYIAFSQFMLIWYAGIPEEATYFHRRWDTDGWHALSIFLVIGHFGVPFFFLISRVTKRNLGMLKLGAIWMVFMHVVDMYWCVMPYAGDHLNVHWMDITSCLAVLGIFFTVIFAGMKKYSLVAVGDPRLHRSLHHVQTT